MVDAAGAWTDRVAALAGVPGLGLVPHRRTIAACPAPDPSMLTVNGEPLPMVVDTAERFYLKAETDTVLVSPADETPAEPGDARPDEIDVALALDRVAAATTLGLRSVRTAWAGLRSFVADRGPAVGAWPEHPRVLVLRRPGRVRDRVRARARRARGGRGDRGARPGRRAGGPRCGRGHPPSPVSSCLHRWHHGVMTVTTIGTERHELFEGSFFVNPHPALAALREHDPVSRLDLSGGATWLLSRHADVRAALTDPRVSKDWRYMLPPEQRSQHPAAPTPMMVLMDPPEHTRLRKLVSRAFTVRRMNEQTPRVQEIADDLLASLPETGTVDLMGAYAFQIPVYVICEMLGVPAADRDDFGAWTKLLVDDSGDGATMDAMGKLHGYLGELIERKRSEPDDKLIASLIEVADADGDRLSPDELLAMVMMLLIAGHETTVNLIGNGMRALLTHPDQLAKLQTDPGLIDSAVEEVLRFDTPVAQTPARFTAEDVTYSGVTIPAGQMVMYSLAAANRDPRWVDDPDTFDITRKTSGAIYFAHGNHHCIGAHLARIEGRVAIGALVADRPQIALAVASSELGYRQSTLIRGLTSLPVNPGPRA